MRAAIVAGLAVLVAGGAFVMTRGGDTPKTAAPVSRPSKVAVKPRPKARKTPKIKVPMAASGRFAVVAGRAAPRKGRGPVVRYLVEVERGLPYRGPDFARAVHETLNDPRGWARFQRVDHGPVRLRVALSSPRTTDSQCLPLRTGGELSCWNGTRSVINALRWAEGVRGYRGNLAAYRDYVISHEVGHGLGHHHLSCPGRGRLAPVMVQQSKSLEHCRPNPWPFPFSGSGSPQAGKR